MKYTIEEGLDSFNNEKDIIENNIVEIAKDDYIQFLEAHLNENDALISALGKLQELFKQTLNNTNEIDLINLIKQEVDELLTSVINKGFKYKKERKNIITTVTEENQNDYLYFLSAVNNIISILLRYQALKKSFDELLINNLRKAIVDVNKELVGFRKIRNIADNLMTEDIYDIAVAKYKKLEKKYRKYFYRAVPIVIIIAILTFLSKKLLMEKFGIDEVSYWVLKISILILGVTLISYFIKQSSHYQRLADQNYQTQVELQAYPTFMESIPTEEAANVRKELALKYFGREIDGNAHKDMSNLISDQMKNTTEMVKATTEAIKNLKG